MEITDIIDAPTTSAIGGCELICSTCADRVLKLWKIGNDSMCLDCVHAWVCMKIDDQIGRAFEQAACVAFNETQNDQLYKLIKSLNWLDGKELRKQVELTAKKKKSEGQ